MPSTREWRPKTKRLSPATAFGEHAHDVVSLTLTLGGAYVEVFEEAVHTCGPLTVQLKPRGVPHTTRTHGGAELLILHVPVDAVRSAGPDPVLVAPGVASAIVLGGFRSLRSGEGPGERLGALLDGVTRSRPDDTEPPAWIACAERRLARELDAPPRLADLAREADVHPVHFARTFRRARGKSVDRWIRRTRVDRVVGALASTAEDVASLALRLGYYDQSHLGRDFRRETGWSPAALGRSLGRSSEVLPRCGLRRTRRDSVVDPRDGTR